MFRASLIDIDEIETGGGAIGAVKTKRAAGGSRLRQGF